MLFYSLHKYNLLTVILLYKHSSVVVLMYIVDVSWDVSLRLFLQHVYVLVCWFGMNLDQHRHRIEIERFVSVCLGY